MTRIRYDITVFFLVSGILPSNWRRYTVPKDLTVLQWVADFSDRVKQLQKISHAANTGGAKGLKVCNLVLEKAFKYRTHVREVNLFRFFICLRICTSGWVACLSLKLTSQPLANSSLRQTTGLLKNWL